MDTLHILWILFWEGLGGVDVDVGGQTDVDGVGERGRGWVRGWSDAGLGKDDGRLEKQRALRPWVGRLLMVTVGRVSTVHGVRNVVNVRTLVCPSLENDSGSSTWTVESVRTEPMSHDSCSIDLRVRSTHHRAVNRACEGRTHRWRARRCQRLGQLEVAHGRKVRVGGV